jgi:site-specific DNA recombinase
MSGRAVLYLRVSSLRQVDGTSLETQEASCKAWCAERDIVVERIFTERGESAKTANRRQFQAMFKYLAGLRKGVISHLVIYKLDRFSRNIHETGVYREALKIAKIKLSSVTEATDESAPGEFLETILIGQGRYDNAIRSERAIAGMKARLSAGRWVWCPPTGYVAGNRGGNSLNIDPKQGPLIQRLFEMVAAGETRGAALAKLTAQGLRSRRGGKLSQESIKRLLSSPVYAGQVVGKEWGIVVKGDFPPLVSQETYDRVQTALSGRSAVAVPHARDRAEYPLRGLLYCPECLKPVTASTSKGEYGTRHRYYRCHRQKGHVNAKAEVIEDAFLALLDRLAPRPERMVFMASIFREVWTEKTSNAASDAEALRRELAKLEARKNRMLEQLADGHVSGDDYAKVSKATSVSIGELRERLDLVVLEDLDIDAAISYLEHLLWNARLTWENSDLQGKQRLQRRIFPKGLLMGKTDVGTPVTHSIYLLLADDLVGEEDMVRPRRFELLTYSFGGCRSIQLSYGRASLA